MPINIIYTYSIKHPQTQSHTYIQMHKNAHTHTHTHTEREFLWDLLHPTKMAIKRNDAK